MIKPFTASMARALIPDENKFEEMVEDSHKRIAAAAEEGMYEVHISFSIDKYERSDFFRLKHFLQKEGYEVSHPLLSNYFIINWRDKK